MHSLFKATKCRRDVFLFPPAGARPLKVQDHFWHSLNVHLWESLSSCWKVWLETSYCCHQASSLYRCSFYRTESGNRLNMFILSQNRVQQEQVEIFHCPLLLHIGFNWLTFPCSSCLLRYSSWCLPVCLHVWLTTPVFGIRLVLRPVNKAAWLFRWAPGLTLPSSLTWLRL